MASAKKQTGFRRIGRATLLFTTALIFAAGPTLAQDRSRDGNPSHGQGGGGNHGGDHAPPPRPQQPAGGGRPAPYQGQQGPRPGAAAPATGGQQGAFRPQPGGPIGNNRVDNNHFGHQLARPGAPGGQVHLPAPGNPGGPGGPGNYDRDHGPRGPDNYNRPDGPRGIGGYDRPGDHGRPGYDRHDGYSRPASPPHSAWNRGWRDDHRYDWHDWRDHNRSIFHVGPYASPYRFYSYRRLGIGYFMESLFFDQRFWIDDPWAFRLPPADGPYRWIRYYDDALLVDIYTGEVVDVIYDFFW